MIELDAHVQDYFHWFTMVGPEQAELITVRHLLTHSSGTSGPMSDKDVVNPDVSEDALETHVRELADYPLRTVGASSQHANTNCGNLGLIGQNVAGQSFEDYVKEHIFLPPEMTNSYASKSEAEANGLAVGHTIPWTKCWVSGLRLPCPCSSWSVSPVRRGRRLVASRADTRPTRSATWLGGVGRDEGDRNT